MDHLVIYDITDDNLRLRVSEKLKDYGLARIQFSAFIGRLKGHELSSLLAELRGMIGGEVENVQIYPLCDVCFKGRVEVGRRKRFWPEEERAKRLAHF